MGVIGYSHLQNKITFFLFLHLCVGCVFYKNNIPPCGVVVITHPIPPPALSFVGDVCLYGEDVYFFFSPHLVLILAFSILCECVDHHPLEDVYFFFIPTQGLLIYPWLGWGGNY